MLKHFMLLNLFVLMAGLTCTQTSNPITSAGGSGESWLIPVGEIRDGGPGKDGIPALSNPGTVFLRYPIRTCSMLQK